MTLPRTDTVVLYPEGALSATASVLHAEPVEGGLAVLLDRTAAHPVDPAWPDQSADRGAVIVGSDEFPLIGCVVGATDGERLFVGADVPVKKGTEGWAFVVVHLLPADAVLQSDRAEVRIDATHRERLGIGHTACHLASLALNRALAGAWRKEPRADALGAPDFDAVACERSTILERGSLDEYRVGRSVRRAGFDPEALADLDAVEAAVRLEFAAWIATGAVVSIEAEGTGLTDRRWWVCALPDGTARIPCGGTHATRLTELEGIEVELDARELEGAVGFAMITHHGDRAPVA
ncbi:MAG: metal-dependent hydrolase [Micrococcales bacterium]|nr:metal-dependent hydrolase [Micrococcales bacterium]